MEYRPKTLVIVRHGETEWNEVAKAVRTGKMEIPAHLKGVPNHRTVLSEAGKKQAVATGKKLAELHSSFDAVFRSPYRRAVQTTDLILGEFPVAECERMVAARVDDFLLVEQNPGVLDPALAGSEEEEQRLYQQYRALAIKFGHFWIQYLGVESWAQVAARVLLFLRELFGEKHHGRKILIVTHGITTLLFRYLLEGISEEALEEIGEKDHPHNCGVYEYQWNAVTGSYDLTKCNEIYY